ncbi:MAG TPA: 3-hydroxyanthranilate 3,4-dioxygenase [Burkholderiales bacterium]|nr:3-hydroxyanthranilate 3,4-dioxygenase [Burkholderiales bacterium]
MEVFTMLTSPGNVKPAFSQAEWIARHMPASRGAIGNKEVFKGADFIYQIIVGPNARNDFHIDPWDEIFYQLQGHIFVNFVDEQGKVQVQRINEGGLFLLPKNVPHSPRRPPGSIGVVIEIPRKPHELDSVAWFCENCNRLLERIDFWCDDIEKGIKDVVFAFNEDVARRTCKHCGSVLPDPRKITHWDERGEPLRDCDRPTQ